MILSELIQQDLIKLDMEAVTKWEAIEELIDHLIMVHELRLSDRQEVVDAVVTREKSLSTGLEHALAVPHGAVDCVSEIIGCVGISREGIPFESRDGKPAKLMVLLVVPKGSFQRHVRTLAGVARLAMNQQLREQILGAKSEEAVMDAIYAFERLEEAEGAEEQ